MARVFSTAFCVALLLATVGAFVLAESAKTELSPIYGTKIDKVFSPVCVPRICDKRFADILFKIRKTESLQAWMERDGERVSTLTSGRVYAKGAVHFEFNGLSDDGVLLPDGMYQPVVRLDHRTITLPNEIQLVTKPPAVIHAPHDVHTHISPDGDHRKDAFFVHYTLNEPGHGVLLVDGRQVELTRRQPLHGVLTWNGKVHLRLQPPGRYLLQIAAQDAAGNRSKPLSIGIVTIRYIELGSTRIVVRPRARFTVRVITDAARVGWLFDRGRGTTASRMLRLRAPKRRGHYHLYVTAARHAAAAIVVVR